MSDTDLIAIAFYRGRVRRYIDSLRCTEGLLAQLMELSLLPDGDQFEQVLVQRQELTWIANTLEAGLLQGIEAARPQGSCCEWRGCRVVLSPAAKAYSRKRCMGAFCPAHQEQSLAAAKRHLPRTLTES